MQWILADYSRLVRMRSCEGLESGAGALELHMLTSLARSQRALCRIIESVADHMEGSEQLAGHMADNLKTISDYQRAMMLKLTNQSQA